MRKIASLILVLVLLLSSNIAMAEAVTTTVIDRTKLSNGVLGINYEAGEKKTKLMIEKDGQKYIYDVYSVKETQRFPLQLGNGEYTVSILENTVDNKYRFVSKDSVRVNVENEHQVYLNSVQNINWNEEMEAIKKARELTKKAKSDEEKIKIIYDYIINNVSYDFEKVQNLTPTYLPDINDIFKNNKGICYDYSSMFAAMLRSLDIPTKLVMGNTTYVREYHAWNEVYLADQDRWVVIDTTVDAGLKKSKRKFDMIKEDEKYTKMKEF